jgi:hypothetical protein
MNVSCPRCKSPMRISDDSLQATFRCPSCRQPLRVPAAARSRPALPQEQPPSTSRTQENSETSMLPRTEEEIVETGTTSRRERTTFVAVLLGILIGVFGFGWFGLVRLVPWSGWNSPIGSMIQTLHGITAIGFAVLMALSIGLAMTRRLRPLCNSVCLFLVLIAAICLAGLLLIATANLVPISAMGVVYVVHALFIGGSAAVGLLLK